VTPEPRTADVLVLGGGLLGSALAFHLSRSKAGEVVLLDPGPIGAGATGRSAGLLSFQGWDRWDARLVRESAEEFRTLSDRWGVGDYRENGGLEVVRTEEGEAWLLRVERELRSEGVRTRLLSPSEVQAVLPCADLDDVRCGLHTPEDACVDPVALSRGYAELARRSGVRVHDHVGPLHLRRGDPGWEVVAADERWSAPRLAVACGAWSKRVLSEAGYALPAAPFRAQACVARPAPLQASFPTLHDFDLNLYLRPAPFGRVLLGDGNENVEVDPDGARPEADPAFVDRVTRDTRALFPGWAAVRPETAWTGVCVSSPDGYPLVGPVPGRDGLFVATGFNGFGVMRAPSLARRLAQGIVQQKWEELVPADPSRFPPDLPPFVPRPEWPILHGEPTGIEVAPAPAVPSPAFSPDEAPAVSYRELTSGEEVQRLRLPPDLSVWFNPFLPTFMLDALGCGGEVHVAFGEEGDVRGVYLWSPTEGQGSVFTSARPVAEHFLGLQGHGDVYTERAWGRSPEVLDVMLADLRDWEVPRRMRNPVRLAEMKDLPRVEALIREVAGAADRAWFSSLPRPGEFGFITEVEGRLVGVSWLSVVGEYGRGHSLVVHPRYRGIGIGTDMLLARMTWLRERGAHQVISEIYQDNPAARVAAERAGMTRVGEIYACPRQ
jgi:sarcosine oxidase, subunit beta